MALAEFKWNENTIIWDYSEMTKKKILIWAGISVALGGCLLVRFITITRPRPPVDVYSNAPLVSVMQESTQVELFDCESESKLYDSHSVELVQGLVELFDLDTENLGNICFAPPKYELIFSNDNGVCVRLLFIDQANIKWVGGCWKYQFELTDDSMKDVVAWFDEKGVALEWGRWGKREKYTYDELKNLESKGLLP